MGKKVKGIPVEIIQAENITVNGKYKNPKKDNIICLKYQGLDRQTLVTFYKKHVKDKRVKLEMTLEIPVKRRSSDQNRLYWALLRIMSYELKGCHGYEEEIHEELLRMYSPRVESILGDEDVPKRSKDMDTEEFAELINAVFKHLAEAGTMVESQNDIRNYWRQYYEWRGTKKKDPLKIKSMEEYRRMVPYCEACLTYTWQTDEFGKDVDTGHICHVVSAGSGGELIPENVFHFCGKHHIEDQHKYGWEKFLEEFPHLRWKVERARQIASHKPLQIQADVKEVTEEKELNIF